MTIMDSSDAAKPRDVIVAELILLLNLRWRAPLSQRHWHQNPGARDFAIRQDDHCSAFVA
jgi:hypothetical protein